VKIWVANKVSGQGGSGTLISFVFDDSTFCDSNATILKP
jgi:hypothetical protein